MVRVQVPLCPDRLAIAPLELHAKLGGILPRHANVECLDLERHLAAIGQRNLGRRGYGTARHRTEVERGGAERDAPPVRRRAARGRAGARFRTRRSAQARYSASAQHSVRPPSHGQSCNTRRSPHPRSSRWPSAGVTRIIREQVDLLPLNIRKALDRIVARARTIRRLGRAGRARIGCISGSLGCRLAHEAERRRLAVVDRDGLGVAIPLLTGWSDIRRPLIRVRALPVLRRNL